MRPQQRFEMKPERPETCVNSVEYIVGEDDQNIDIDSDCEKADDSTSSESQAGISSPNVVSRVINGKLPVDQTYVRALSTVVTSAPVFDPHGATDSSQAPVASEPVSPPMPAIIAMFENDSRDVALMKHSVVPSFDSPPSSSAIATSTGAAAYTSASAVELLSTGCTSCAIVFSTQRQ
ncbi:hypothetical protein Q8A73_008106 [Channa argus]|nr:hypothetical protein Q8A73_008106 [Channa argus]